MCKTIFEILQSLKPHLFITRGAPTTFFILVCISKSKLFPSNFGFFFFQFLIYNSCAFLHVRYVLKWNSSFFFLSSFCPNIIYKDNFLNVFLILILIFVLDVISFYRIMDDRNLLCQIYYKTLYSHNL